MRQEWDVIVIGGGHAGTEAVRAASAVLGPDAAVALVTLDPARIGQMSCNPAIGGLAKGQMVREIDALGGLMGRAIDATGIMFKMLNTSKGPAVRGPRAQADKYAYAAEVQRLVAELPGVTVIAGAVDDLVVEGDRIAGVVVGAGAGVVTGAGAGAGAGMGAGTGAGMGAGTGAGMGTGVGTGAGTGTGTGMDTGAGTGAGVDTGAGTGADTDAGTGTGAISIARCGPPGRRSLSCSARQPWAMASRGGRAGTGAGAGATPPVFSSVPDAAARTDRPTTLRAGAVVLTTGTFMRGLMHTGEQQTPGGRVGEAAPSAISDALRRLGFELGRLKTGTPARLDRASIDWDGLERQRGDADPAPFSDLSPACLPGARFPAIAQAECRMTRTTAAVHDVIRANLHRAPMYNGGIEAETGPRYCPSIEDKVVRFADRASHHVFLEPESLHTREVYCNGISTSLPRDVQEAIVHGMPGCEHAVILRYGYAVEYDMVWPHQIDATCMTKHVDGLFLAGQINCTTGYEEAGGQGLIAGLNAARYVNGEPLVRLRRDEAFIGVMLDDLVTKTPREPYRMFTSRAEHRLHLRADNAGERLTPRGRELGLVGDARRRAHEAQQAALAEIRGALAQARDGHRSLLEIARRPDVTAQDLTDRLSLPFERTLVERVVTETRYAGYIARQSAEIKRQVAADGRRVPDWIDLRAIPGLRAEAAEVLAKFRPATFGQASRLPGVNPADMTLLAVAVERGRRERSDAPPTNGA